MTPWTYMIYDMDQELLAEFRRQMGDCWPHPPLMDTWAFLVTEVGEIGDQLIRSGHGQRTDYVRHHARGSDLLRKEVVDAYIMLLTLANHLDLELPDALWDRLKEIEKRIDVPDLTELTPEQIDAIRQQLDKDMPPEPDFRE